MNEIKILKLKKPDKNWDLRVRHLEEGTVTQSTYITDIYKIREKKRPIFLIFCKKDEILAQMILCRWSLIHPYLIEKPLNALTTILSEKFFGVYNFIYAPLIFDRKNYYKILDIILEYLKEHEFKDIYPPIHSEYIDQEKIKSIFERHGFKSIIWGTFIVDLRKPLDELWRGLNKNSRYAIRKCEKLKIYVKKVENIKELKEYYGMLKETCNRNNIPCKSFKNIEFMWKHGTRYGISSYIIAYKDGIPLAGLGVSIFNGILFQGGVCISNYAIKNKIYAGDYLQWHLIKLGKKIGARIYDLAGVNPYPKNNKEKGIYNFKKRWGGRLKIFYIYHRFDEKKYQLFKKIYRRLILR